SSGKVGPPVGGGAQPREARTGRGQGVPRFGLGEPSTSPACWASFAQARGLTRLQRRFAPPLNRQVTDARAAQRPVVERSERERASFALCFGLRGSDSASEH